VDVLCRAATVQAVKSVVETEKSEVIQQLDQLYRQKESDNGHIIELLNQRIDTLAKSCEAKDAELEQLRVSACVRESRA
jgi:hypothetical protein